MKKYFLAVFSAITVVAFLSSCTPKPAEMILGKWQWVKYSSPQYDAQMKQIDEMAASTDSMVAMQGKMMKEKIEANMSRIGENTMEFQKEGKMINTFVRGESMENEEGTYKISEDGKTLSLIDKTGREDKFDLTKLTKDEMSIHIANPQAEMTIDLKKAK